MKYYCLLSFSLSVFILATEEKNQYYQKEPICIYIVNETNSYFEGYYSFVVADGVALIKKQEDRIKIKPGHKQTLELVGYKHLWKKLTIGGLYSTRSSILCVDQFAFRITQLTMTAEQISIENGSIVSAQSYPETPVERSRCIIL